MKFRFLTIISLLGAGAAIADEQETALEGAMQRWQANASPSYEYAYFKECDCYRDGPPLTVVSVRNGRVGEVSFIRQDSGREITARDDALSSYWTIDELFSRIASALEREAELQVEYHATLGYPEHLYIDPDPEFIGDETDLRLTRVDLR